MVKSEIVATAFKCVMTSMEHRVREWFLYRDRAIYHPHYDVDALHAICEQRDVAGMRIINAPQSLHDASGDCLFLAGSIEMGTPIDWQNQVITLLSGSPWTILNPRRREWDASWEQSIHSPQFYEQVNWELEALELADVILMYFAPGTEKSYFLTGARTIRAEREDGCGLSRRFLAQRKRRHRLFALPR